MSSANGRTTGGSSRGSSARALSAPVPVVWHHHHRASSAWVATSVPSASGAALPHSPPGAHGLPISGPPQQLRGVSMVLQCAASHGSATIPMLAAGMDLRTLVPAPRRGGPAPALGFGRAPHPLGPHDVVHQPPHAAFGVLSSRPCSAAASGPCPAAYGSVTRWPVPSRCRTMQTAAAPAALGPSGGGGGASGGVLPRPPSPSYSLPTSRYFEGFCPEGATECSAVWGQLRWCSTWQQMRRLYDNMLHAEAAAVAATAAVAAQVAAAAAGDSSNGSDGDSPTSSVDVTATSSSGNGGDGGSSDSTLRPASPSPASSSSRAVPCLLTRDETYAFLLQLQDFYHLRLDAQELDELQAFRCRLVRDLSHHVKRLDAEQLEALCCASAVSGKCLARERADAVQERLLKILTVNNGTGAAVPHPTSSNGHVSSGNGHVSSGGGGAASAGEGRRRRGSAAVGGFQVLTPALNIIFALYDHGYLPQVALLQAVFSQAVDHCSEVTRSQWHGLQGLARRFRFLLDEHWLDDLHSYVRDPLSCTTDYGRLASILGCISAFTVNKAMEALDTRVLVVVEAIERRYDEGRSLLSAHQLCVFTALLVDMQSPFRSKWLGIAMDHLASCRSHLAGLPPATLVLAVELVLRGRGWDEQRLLSKLLRQLFTTYAKHPASYAHRGSSNVSGCPPRAPSRIITASAVAPVSLLPSSPASSSFASPSLAAMAAAADWDVDVGGAGGAASPPLDLASLVDWLASKVPPSPGPELSDTLDFLRPFVSDLVESGRPQLASLEPRRIPGLIKAVAILGYSPSREWVSEAFTLVAGGAEALSGAELVAMLRLSHAQALPLPHSTLDAVSRQHARILPLMRAVDLERLLECWVADRYIPSREQLEGFFDALCDVFGIEPAILKAAAAAASGPAQTLALVSFDSDTSAVELSSRAASVDLQPASGSRRAPSSSYLEDLQVLQAAGGSISAGAADGVTGAMMSSVGRTRSTTTIAKGGGTSGMPVTQGNSGSGGGGDPAAAGGSTLQAASAAAAAATAAGAAGIAPDAAAAKVVKAPSLGSLDPRLKDSLLQRSEAKAMLTLLEQYRGLLLEAKRSDLLIAMNVYRAAVTSALREAGAGAGTGRGGGGGGGQGRLGAPVSSRLLQAALRGEHPGVGCGAAATAAAAAAANARSAGAGA